MRHTRILALAGLSTALLGTANAEIETSASVGYHSEYVYRGLNLGDDLVDLNLGFSGSTDLADWNVGLGFGIWDGFDEFHAEASVSRAICGEPFPLIVSVGLANTSYSSGTMDVAGLGTLQISPPDRLEPFVGVSTSLGGLDLSAKVFFNASDGTGEWAHDEYWEVDASYSADLGGNLSGSLSAGMGVWDTDPFLGVLGDGVHYSVTGGLQYAASDTITLSAYITHLMNGDWNLDDETFGGALVSVSF
jgi:hypothetical protein